MKNLAIYTTYCGSTANKTFNMQLADNSYPHFFISNNSSILADASSVGWIPIFINLEVSDDPVISAYQAKIAKVIPHTINPLQNFDYLFYKDDKLSIDITTLDQWFDILNRSSAAMVLRSHEHLIGNVLFEFEHAMVYERYRSQARQVVKYITEEIYNGCKLDCKMYQTGLILRNMRHPEIQLLNNTWYDHIKRCGIECQISFDMLAQKFKSIASIY